LIRRRDVLDVLDSVVERGSPVLANRLLARLKHFFKWTVERGILEASPVLGLRPPSPESPRDRVLTDHELRAVWKAAEDFGYPFGAAIQLLILTGQRRSEVLEAEWSEIDLPGRLWTVPRERSKTDSAHLVPLSDAAADLLSELPRVGTRLVFTTNGTAPFSGVSKAFECLDLRVAEHLGCPIPQWRPHDLRRTFASGCARLGIPVHVIERALNHTSGTFGGIVGVYQRHEYAEERRRAMDAWGTHLVRLVGKESTDADTLPS
jgi:integrase